MISTIAFHFKGNTVHKLFARVYLVDVVIEHFEPVFCFAVCSEPFRKLVQPRIVDGQMKYLSVSFIIKCQYSFPGFDAGQGDLQCVVTAVRAEYDILSPWADMRALRFPEAVHDVRS